MKVFKFGGASVKNAESLKNVVQIIRKYEDRLFIVVSAMDKTTNRLEAVVKHLLTMDAASFESTVMEVEHFHQSVLKELNLAGSEVLEREMEELFGLLRKRYHTPISEHLGFEYDQVVSLGEVLSSKILAHVLKSEKVEAQWLDARQLIRTDNNYKEGKVDWDKTTQKIQSCIGEFPQKKCFVSQGFIGHTSEGFTTTLGREGSDYSAAIFAYALTAQDFSNTQLLKSISYKEAIELAYFGASVIHPKTVKPLQNKNIKLYIKSFIDPESEGTVIQAEQAQDQLIPSFIVKKHQILISISANDFSFINEEALAKVFERFYSNTIKINLMQNSALNFSTLVDADKVDMEKLIELFKPEFSCKYNENVELLTIRHYTPEIIADLLAGRTVLLEQRSRQTARFVLTK
jgi:aspartate kinase